jgi:6-phosphogluconolactonase (cycloisomerase 2 family)
MYALTDRPPPDAAADDPHGSLRWWSYEGDGSLGERGAMPLAPGASAAVLTADEARLYVLGLGDVTFAERGSEAGTFAERDRAVLAPGGVSSLLLHPSGNFLVVAHHPSPSDDPPRRELEVLPLGADGRFASAPQVIASSTDHARLRWSPDRRFVIGMSCDQTSLSWYRVDAQARTLGPATLAIADTGGNDLAFHPRGDRAFVAGPGGLITLRYDAASGAVLRTGFTSYFRAGEDYGDSCAYSRVKVHPSGRFVYALAANALRTFSTEGESLVLRDILEHARFRAPSALVIAPGGERVFVANAANVINAFRLDPISGIPTFESNAPTATWRVSSEASSSPEASARLARSRPRNRPTGRSRRVANPTRARALRTLRQGTAGPRTRAPPVSKPRPPRR